MAKRSLDIILSLFGLIILLPLFGVIAVFTKRDSQGPILHKSQRVGKGGKLFEIYKFRTMYENADSISNSSSCPDDDPRVTRFGAVLRRYKLNELPQLINVLRGEMSLVGPRPQVKWAVDRYSDQVRQSILSVRPGITDYASIAFCNEGQILNGSADPDKDYLEKIEQKKIRLQLDYVNNRSFWVDIEILAETARVLLLGQRGSDGLHATGRSVLES